MKSFAPTDFRQRALGAGLRMLRASRLTRLVAPLTRGLGAILMFHHVRPWTGGAFAPNRGLEITPEFLDETVVTLRELGFDILSIDAAILRIKTGDQRERPFAVLTFDDGYRDNLVHALPVLRRHEAPFTLYVTTGFADRIARLWWIELEEAIRRLDHIEARVGDARISLAAGTDAEKSDSFKRLYWSLRAGSEADLLKCIGDLAVDAGIDRQALVAGLCMDWDEIGVFARESLCTIGVHTLTHPMLAKHPPDVVRRELAVSRSIIEAKIGAPAVHLAYPVGDPTSAGVREFALASEFGFASAVTTRKGMIFADHAAHLTALPRLSINGGFQTRAALETLLSGAPFYLRNFGRRLDVA